ncbi:hypothetical protein [Candidatus Formimonas warabiya]|uniref:Uncharacterized protein n=1 Tax=Formimonas warabiya TaxID=1761012 RepID=A0A3G1KVR1_FORW1|nr:hypothetical protein [Candidatus Formimonas warabiya]ATW26578.1 hypothetical protein DCMF_19110 [Candidatus Formimonas warabiya]
MDKLIDKLSLYDFFGYIIPGFLGTWALNVFFVETLQVNFIFKLDVGFINSVLFVAISYYIGVLLHELSELLQEHFFKRIWKGLPSERFLVDSDNKYSTEFKASLKKMIESKFGLIVGNDNKKSQEAFNLIYSGLQGAGKDEKAQLFNSLYGMYRNFFAGTVMCLLVFLIKGFVLVCRENWQSLFESFLYAFLFLLATLTLMRRLRRFGERLADYVIRDYYNYYLEHKSE